MTMLSIKSSARLTGPQHANTASLSLSLTLFLSLRYLGPNTGNMHIVADLYAEVVGVVAQSR